MARLTRLDHESRSVNMATMEYMAAGVSNEDTLASKGDLVLLISTNNGGGSIRYDQLSPLGEDVVDALKFSDAAFKVIKPEELDDLIRETKNNLEDDGLLDVEIHAFQFGKYYAYYETVV